MKPSFCNNRMLPGPLKDAVDVWTWKRCYSIQEVNSALSKVQLVGYSQKVVRPSFLLHYLNRHTLILTLEIKINGQIVHRGKD